MGKVLRAAPSAACSAAAAAGLPVKSHPQTATCSRVAGVVPFATGGVVSGATAFPMADGRTGLMGEAGAEAIMPLSRGPGGKLGVRASGGGGAPVHQHMSFGSDVNRATVDEVQMRQIAGRCSAARFRAPGATSARRESRAVLA
jgi:lambda family phage tail tape measure protein